MQGCRAEVYPFIFLRSLRGSATSDPAFLQPTISPLSTLPILVCAHPPWTDQNSQWKVSGKSPDYGGRGGLSWKC